MVEYFKPFWASFLLVIFCTLQVNGLVTNHHLNPADNSLGSSLAHLWRGTEKCANVGQDCSKLECCRVTNSRVVARCNRDDFNFTCYLQPQLGKGETGEQLIETNPTGDSLGETETASGPNIETETPETNGMGTSAAIDNEALTAITSGNPGEVEKEAPESIIPGEPESNKEPITQDKETTEAINTEAPESIVTEAPEDSIEAGDIEAPAINITSEPDEIFPGEIPDVDLTVPIIEPGEVIEDIETTTPESVETSSIDPVSLGRTLAKKPNPKKITKGRAVVKKPMIKKITKGRTAVKKVIPKKITKGRAAPLKPIKKILEGPAVANMPNPKKVLIESAPPIKATAKGRVAIKKPVAKKGRAAEKKLKTANAPKPVAMDGPVSKEGSSEKPCDCKNKLDPKKAAKGRVAPKKQTLAKGRAVAKKNIPPKFPKGRAAAKKAVPKSKTVAKKPKPQKGQATDKKQSSTKTPPLEVTTIKPDTNELSTEQIVTTTNKPDLKKLAKGRVVAKKPVPKKLPKGRAAVKKSVPKKVIKGRAAVKKTIPKGKTAAKKPIPKKAAPKKPNGRSFSIKKPELVELDLKKQGATNIPDTKNIQQTTINKPHYKELPKGPPEVLSGAQATETTTVSNESPNKN